MTAGRAHSSTAWRRLSWQMARGDTTLKLTTKGTKSTKCQYAWMFYVIFELSVANLSSMEGDRGSKSAPVFCHSDSPQAAEPIRAGPAVQPYRSSRESNLLESLAFPRSNTEFW